MGNPKNFRITKGSTIYWLSLRDFVSLYIFGSNCSNRFVLVPISLLSLVLKLSLNLYSLFLIENAARSELTYVPLSSEGRQW